MISAFNELAKPFYLKISRVNNVKMVATRTFSSKPSVKPKDPRFGSGPCKKRPGYDLNKVLQSAALGRSHRGSLGKGKLKEAIEKSKSLLGLPSDYLLGIVPASDTGAFEMAMWSMLGPKPIDAFFWESFGKGWVTDILSQLKFGDKTTVHEADYGSLPDMTKARSDADVIFTFNGTTSGVRVDNCDFISDNRTGLSFCDATSAVFAMEMPWKKLDVVTYSWQKVLGGEGAHGILILSPKAVERLETFSPEVPLPKIFRMTKGGKINKGIFEGSTINTPSMLCVEDYIDALDWTESVGGVKALIEMSNKNLEIVSDFVEKTPWIDFLAKETSITSNTSICLSISDLDAAQIKEMVKLLETEEVAFDIGSYRDAPPGLRIWGGATVENEDMQALMPWIEWAHDKVK